MNEAGLQKGEAGLVGCGGLDADSGGAWHGMMSCAAFSPRPVQLLQVLERPVTDVKSRVNLTQTGLPHQTQATDTEVRVQRV